MNYVLDRPDFKEQIVRMIPKTENTFKHKYNQNDTIRAIRSTIQLKQCNQSDTINNTARAMQLEQSKQYGQQYVQNEPGYSYIVSSTYAKTRNLSEKPDIQEVNIRR